MALRYIADPEQAAKRNRAGLRFLYGLQFPGDIPAIGKDCKAAVASQTASWLALGLKATAAETKSLLLNGILDRLFQLDTTDALPSKTQFAAVLADLKAQGLLKPAKALLNQMQRGGRRRLSLPRASSAAVRLAAAHRPVLPSISG